MKLSIIIPVYNEEKTVEELLKRVVQVNLPKGVKREIIVVDDGSTDSSKLKISNFIRSVVGKQSSKLQFKNRDLRLIEHKENKGKGAAVRTGIKAAKGDIFLIQDADLEYNPKDYPRLLSPILTKKAKVVYGTRLKHYPLRLFGKRRTPLVLHYLGNKFLTLITNLLYGNNLSDVETCYKVFTKEVIKPIKLKANRFDFEPEITAKLLKARHKIYEVPIKVKPRGYDDGKKITWRDGLQAAWVLIKYKFTD